MGVHVAFFRNLNLGHRGSPSRDQLLAAFGDTEPGSFQVNGTVVFRSTAPAGVVRQARAALTESCGWDDVAPVRTAAWVVALARELADVPDHTEVTLYDARADVPVDLPYRPERGRVTVLAADRRRVGHGLGGGQETVRRPGPQGVQDR